MWLKLDPPKYLTEALAMSIVKCTVNVVQSSDLDSEDLTLKLRGGHRRLGRATQWQQGPRLKSHFENQFRQQPRRAHPVTPRFRVPIAIATKPYDHLIKMINFPPCPALCLNDCRWRRRAEISEGEREKL